MEQYVHSVWHAPKAPKNCFHGGHRQPMCDPEGCSTAGGRIRSGPEVGKVAT